MSAHEEAIERFKTVMSGPSEENIAALSELLADDVHVVGMIGAGDDKDTVAKGLNNPMAAALFGAAEWPDPEVDGDTATLIAKLPAGAPLGGMLFEITTDGAGRITQVLEEMIPAPAPAPTPLS